MPTIGETLREARLRQRLDIADVEASTKIRAKYLRALENEEFALLPGSTFVKTFLRTYADSLGLDAHLLVEEYRANYEGPDEAELQPLTPPAVTRRQREPRRQRAPGGGGPGRLPIVIGAVLALLVFLVVLGWNSDDEEGSEDPARQAADRTETSRERTTTEPARDPERRKPKPKPAAPRNVTLQITPVGPTYVCLDRGDGTETLFEGTISSPQTFRGRRVRLNLGRTSVQIRLNGKRFDVPPSSSPVGYDFTPRGGRELPSGQRPCA